MEGVVRFPKENREAAGAAGVGAGVAEPKAGAAPNAGVAVPKENPPKLNVELATGVGAGTGVGTGAGVGAGAADPKVGSGVVPNEPKENRFDAGAEEDGAGVDVPKDGKENVLLAGAGGVVVLAPKVAVLVPKAGAAEEPTPKEKLVVPVPKENPPVLGGGGVAERAWGTYEGEEGLYEGEEGLYVGEEGL